MIWTYVDTTIQVLSCSRCHEKWFEGQARGPHRRLDHILEESRLEKLQEEQARRSKRRKISATTEETGPVRGESAVV